MSNAEVIDVALGHVARNLPIIEGVLRAYIDELEAENEALRADVERYKEAGSLTMEVESGSAPSVTSSGGPNAPEMALRVRIAELEGELKRPCGVESVRWHEAEGNRLRARIAELELALQLIADGNPSWDPQDRARAALARQ